MNISKEAARVSGILISGGQFYQGKSYLLPVFLAGEKGRGFKEVDTKRNFSTVKDHLITLKQLPKICFFARYSLFTYHKFSLKFLLHIKLSLFLGRNTVFGCTEVQEERFAC